jgi:predicted ATP-binding protein involved in virulence
MFDDEFEFHRFESPKKVSTVDKYKNELIERIKFVDAQYSRLAQQLDHEFPRRLIDAIKNADDTKFDIENLELVENMHRRLVESGLLEKSRLGKLELHREDAVHAKAGPILSLYTADQQKKLEVFDEILNKIETIKEIINSHFQRKKIRISPDKGYTILSSNNKEIPLNKLSSGEQHQLVLFHSLLFDMQPKSLIMIDEPEISLHVAWQQVFIENLQKISKNLNCHFLIATHSPQIINDNWDFTQSLVQIDS